MADIARSISGACLNMSEKHYIKISAIVNGIYEQVKNIKNTKKILLKNMAKYIYDKTEILPTMKMIVLMRHCFIDKLPEGVVDDNEYLVGIFHSIRKSRFIVNTEPDILWQIES